MVDFIEYVVGELKSKRLSHRDAAALMRQFSARSSGRSRTFMHPLLHGNTSDLRGQRYSSTFTGDEFFLVDHQVKAGDEPGRKVLPAVAYLEMAREALEQAWPCPDGHRLELRNVVWARPVFVSGDTEVSIALVAVGDEQIDFEIYGHDADQESIHCQGRGVWSRRQAALRLDVEQLKGEMNGEALAPELTYAAFARMGLIYGPTFQAIAAVHRGDGQVLAELRLPRSLETTSKDYALHPSLMDSALQAAIGLFGDLSEPASGPPLPFALDSLRIDAPCPAQAIAWMRYAPGSHAGDPLVKLDVDLCDALGNVCVQMHGVSTRVLSREIARAGGATVDDRPQIAASPSGPAEQPVEIDAESLFGKTQEYL
ncbi:MAG: hypothetical protein JWN02_1856, partial [Acidobacteria bacterium]|nr:hypothetical protein [Acidobacteriota bacterium]